MSRLAALLILLLAACSVGTPTGFVARSNHTCDTANHTIAALKAPADPKAQLTYALDRYTAVERATSTLTDSSLPGGRSGEELRQGWLRPARVSLSAGIHDLERLRAAVRGGDPESATTAFAAAVTAGTRGVDTALLRGRGLTGCATLFEP